MRHPLFVGILSLAAILASARQLPANPQVEPVVRLTVRPVATTQASLQYKLLPDLTDQTPGNAATMYLMASKMGPDRKQAENLENQATDYLDLPIEQVPRAKAEELLGWFRSKLRMSDLAAHRQDAQWDYSIREEGVDALLPHLNDMRGLDNLWSLQTRLQTLDNDWAAAARTMQDRFSLAHQLNRQAVDVQGLVATGIASETLDRGVRDWISHGDAPNLYWPLSSLPTPFIDVHEIALWERPIIYFTFPVLRDARNGADDPDRWREFLVQAAGLADSQFARRRDTPDNRLRAAVLAAAAYPRARAYLLSACGRTPAQVDAMSVDQAVGTYLGEQYRRVSDDAWKAWELPFWEGQADLQRSMSAIASMRQETAANPLLAFVPQLDRARHQFARIDREIALLRIVEAVRDYAARHDGRPPATLDSIQDLPVPIDPVRGQPFRYEQHGQAVTIDAPSYDEYASNGERYELTLVK